MPTPPSGPGVNKPSRCCGPFTACDQGTIQYPEAIDNDLDGLFTRTKSATGPESPAESDVANLVQRWLLQQEESEALRVLRVVNLARPRLLRLAVGDEALAVDLSSEVSPSFGITDGSRSRVSLDTVISTPVLARLPLAATDALQEEKFLAPQDVVTILVPTLPTDSCPANFLPKDPGLQVSPRSDSVSPLAFRENPEDGLIVAPDEAGEEPVVQFSTSMYFCRESEESVTLDIVRIGNKKGRCEVNYRTKDASAKAGVNFVPVQGQLLFEPGDASKQIQVKIHDNDVWQTTVEFSVVLEDEGLTGAVLGRYLKNARVKILDNDTFPSNKFTDVILAGDITKFPKWSILIDYFKLNWGNALVRRGTIKMVLGDQVDNLYAMLNLVLGVILVDLILAPETQGETPEEAGDDEGGDEARASDVGRGVASGFSPKEGQLLVVCLTMLLPYIVLHYLDFAKLFWKVGGTSRKMVQGALFRQFLNYDEVPRSELNDADMIMAISVDAYDLVHDGYLNMLNLLKSVGLLLMIIVYEIVVPPIMGRPWKFTGFVASVGFPAVLFAFGRLRSDHTTKQIKHREECRGALVDSVQQTVTCYRLIADYSRRAHFADRFDKAIADYNGAHTRASVVITHNAYFSQWITLILMVAYTFWGGTQVLDTNVSGDKNGLTVGVFLANLRILAKIGRSWGGMYTTFLKMEAVFPSLVRVVSFMNAPTDTDQRMTLSQARQKRTAEIRQKLRDEGIEQGVLDLLPIQVSDVNISYSVRCKSRTSKSAMTSYNVNCFGKMEIKQGQYVALIGGKAQGKSTLLKMLGGVLLPATAVEGAVSESDGCCFVPAHLRVLHVSQSPMFFLGSLLENLTFGVAKGDPSGTFENVLDICQRVGVDKSICDRFLNNDVHLNWAEVLSQTQRQLVNLARGLIANPNVLLIHKPSVGLDEQTSHRIFGLFKEFVRNRGLVHDNRALHHRRPRTCIATVTRTSDLHMFDATYRVSQDVGIMKCNAADITEDMLC